MVKLFVGNLAEGVDSHRLRNLFLQYVNVQECDVLKNYAFVHVPTDEDADLAIKELDKTVLEGREIHIERSTSRLRKEPGMSDKCFTCGALDHKTPQCPQEQSRRKKRLNETDDYAAKRTNNGVQAAATVQQGNSNQCWGYKIPGPEADPELPCPINLELRPLYDQYIESRTRYHYFREKLAKELSLQPGNVGAPLSGPVNLGRIDLTRTVPPTMNQNQNPGYTNYPGTNTTSQSYSTSYQSTSSYPGAQSSIAPNYPGAQAPSYSSPQSAYGYNQSYNTTGNYSTSVNNYTNSGYQRQTTSYSTPNYAK